jgi:hypothetical protein
VSRLALCSLCYVVLQFAIDILHNREVKCSLEHLVCRVKDELFSWSLLAIKRYKITATAQHLAYFYQREREAGTVTKTTNTGRSLLNFEVSLVCLIQVIITNKTNSGASVRQPTTPTERPPLVVEVSANFSGERVSRGQRNGSPRPLISVF